MQTESDPDTKLLSDDPAVRIEGAESFHTSPSALERAYTIETDPKVRNAMISRLRNPELLREALSREFSPETAAAVTANRSAPSVCIEAAYRTHGDSSFSVRIGAACNPNTPPDIICMLLRSPDPLIQTSALRNPGLTFDELRRFTGELLLKINSGEMEREIRSVLASKAGQKMTTRRVLQNRINARNAGRTMHPFRAGLKEAGIRWYTTKNAKLRFYWKLPDGRDIEVISEHDSWDLAERDPALNRHIAQSGTATK